MMEYKLIACDMDETLLNNEHLCPRANIEAIMKASKEYGVKFVPATGRGFAQISKVLKELGLDDVEDEYVISYNGASLSENKGSKVLSFNGLDYDIMKELAEFGWGKDVCVLIGTFEGPYGYDMKDNERQRLIGQGLKFVEKKEKDVSFLKDTPICKILFQSEDIEYLHSLEAQIDNRLKEKVTISYSSNRYMEINQKGVHKGQGLKELAKLLNIPMEQTIAIGDNYNDLSMLEVAGLSIAANNAIDDVKEVCDYVTKADNNEGVVAEAIRKYIFHEDI